MLRVRKRLDQLEQKMFVTANQSIMVFQNVGESRDDADQKIERWKAGECVADVQSNEPYSGRDLDIWYVKAVAPGSLEANDR